MSDVVIFGIEANAQLAHYYLTTDSPHTVVGFTVDRDYMPSEAEFCGLPVVPFEDIEDRYDPADVRILAPLTAADMNRLRARVFERIREKGYRCISYVSSRATVLSDAIGENCFILEDNTIQPFVEIGDNVVLWSGNHLGHHSRVRDHVFVTSQAVISGFCDIGPYSFLGVNCTLRDGLTLAEGSFIAMGACVTEATDAWRAYAGNPARRLAKKSTEMAIYHLRGQP